MPAANSCHSAPIATCRHERLRQPRSSPSPCSRGARSTRACGTSRRPRSTRGGPAAARPGRRTEAPDVRAVVEVASVGPQHVREVVHQRVVLLGLDGRTRTGRRPSRSCGSSPRSRRTAPTSSRRSASGRSRGRPASAPVLLEDVLAVHPDQRRRVVRQRVDLLAIHEPAGGVELRRDEVVEVLDLGRFGSSLNWLSSAIAELYGASTWYGSAYTTS